MKYDLITIINAISCYLKDKDAHKCCTIIFNVHQ